MKTTKTPMIKSKFSNAVHKILELNIDKPYRKRWQFKKELTDKEKIDAFDKMHSVQQEASSELRSYQYKRREIKRRDKLRKEKENSK